MPLTPVARIGVTQPDAANLIRTSPGPGWSSSSVVTSQGLPVSRMIAARVLTFSDPSRVAANRCDSALREHLDARTVRYAKSEAAAGERSTAMFVQMKAVVAALSEFPPG